MVNFINSDGTKWSGEFVEVCASSAHRPYWTWNTDYKREQHCDCNVCEPKLKKEGLKRCKAGQRCEACLTQYVKNIRKKNE